MEEISLQLKLSSLKKSLQDMVKEHDYLDDEVYLLQWLKAKNMDRDATEEAIRQSMKWRRENKVYDIKNEKFPQEFIKSFPMRCDFETKDGIPVNYSRENEVGTLGLLNGFGKHMLVRYVILHLLKMEKIQTDYNKKKNLHVLLDSPESIAIFTALMDGKGYTMKHVACIKMIPYYMEVIKICTNYFTNLGQDLLCINTNKFGQIALKIVKPLLERSSVKLRVYGPEEETWARDVYELMEPAVLRELQKD